MSHLRFCRATLTRDSDARQSRAIKSQVWHGTKPHDRCVPAATPDSLYITWHWGKEYYCWFSGTSHTAHAVQSVRSNNSPQQLTPSDILV